MYSTRVLYFVEYNVHFFVQTFEGKIRLYTSGTKGRTLHMGGTKAMGAHYARQRNMPKKSRDRAYECGLWAARV